MLTRRNFTCAAIAASFEATTLSGAVPAKTVVLTLDDAVKSHRTFVAPLLKELGHRATFFISHLWMPDQDHFLSWEEVAELHQMGFEIGNHSWTHADFSIPRNAARLAGELALVENELKRVKVPQPVSFAYSGNFFGPEAVHEVQKAGYRFARRGEMPEVPFGQLVVGAAYQPTKHHPLLIPTTGDAYPNWTFEHFLRVVTNAREGQIVVLQFHGVPDIVHPWVHTPPENFERYMRHLKSEGFRVIALKDVEPWLPPVEPADPTLQLRHPQRGKVVLPREVEATQSNLSYWLPNMLQAHHYSLQEASEVCGLPPAEVKQKAEALPALPSPLPRVLPYPGGRQLRIGFLDGCINPMRGTKASVFLPWDPASYVVVDLPEAIFCNLGLLFLGHTHVPTIWNEQNVIIENTDWTLDGPTLRSLWKLPNNVSLGASLTPVEDRIEMDLWLRNGTSAPLSKLRTQICVLLKEAAGFNQQTIDNKDFGKEIASVRSADGKHTISTQWERCGRTWGAKLCPCLHSDPVLPDCAPGETVRVQGKLWFA